MLSSSLSSLIKRRKKKRTVLAIGMYVCAHMILALKCSSFPPQNFINVIVKGELFSNSHPDYLIILYS